MSGSGWWPSHDVTAIPMKASIRYTNFFIVFLLEFYTYADTGLEPVTAVNNKLRLYLPVELPLATHDIAVFIPGVDSSYYFMSIRAD